MDNHCELKSFRNACIISHWYLLIFFMFKQYNIPANEEKINLQLVVRDSPEWQIWAADLCEKLPYLTLCVSSSSPKLKQSQQLLMPWIFVCAVSKPFLSWNAVVAVLTLGVCRHYHHDLSNHLQTYCVSRLLKKCGKVILGISVNIKTVCHHWKCFLLEHQLYVFTFMCGIGSWFFFFFDMGFPEQLLCPLKLLFFHFQISVSHVVLIEPFCTIWEIIQSI